MKIFHAEVSVVKKLWLFWAALAIRSVEQRAMSREMKAWNRNVKRFFYSVDCHAMLQIKHYFATKVAWNEIKNIYDMLKAQFQVLFFKNVLAILFRSKFHSILQKPAIGPSKISKVSLSRFSSKTCNRKINLLSCFAKLKKIMYIAMIEIIFLQSFSDTHFCCCFL